MARWLNLDRIGIGLSLACGLHCLIVPIAFTLVPSLLLALHSFQAPLRPWAMALLRMQTYDRWLIGTALIVALVSFVLGWHRHRRASPLIWLAVSAALLLSSLYGPRVAGGVHVLALLTGSVLLIVAHIQNLRLRLVR